MKPLKLSPAQHKTLKPLVATIVAATCIVIAVLVWLNWPFSVNYAQEVAKPIEASLVKAGAVKMCERGDAGRGSDNREPWYGAIYEIGKDVESTRVLIKSSLTADGFSGGQFNLDSQYKEWTITDISKKNTYASLSDGQINFSATVYEQKHFDAASDKSFCTLSGQGKKEGVTTLAIGIRLPSYK